VYHFFFVPLTLGLSVMVAIMETLYVSSGNEVYKRMTKFWGKLFLINFALGVVTGIVQEFQFGMNWSEYSRFVGDIFGAPLAIEALLAFFLESTFIGIWLFGWDRLSKRMHAAAMWMVAIGSTVSAYWILVANSFMQQPVGYSINEGRAEMTNFLEVIFNPNVWYQFPHVLFSGFITASFFVLGISAYHLLRKKESELFKRSFQLAAIFAAIFTLLTGMNGHSQAQHMVKIQPMKMAAAEGLWNTESPASFSIFTIGNLDSSEEVFSIRIPSVLSLLSFNQLTGEVKGMSDLQVEYESTFGPGDYIPPAYITYWSFRIMVGAGILMILLAIWALFLSMGEIVEKRKTSLKILIFAIALPYLANTAGWMLTEVGRFPWAVYGLIKIKDSVSVVVNSAMVWFSLSGYILVYTALIVVTIYLMRKYAKAGPTPIEDRLQVTEEPEPSITGG
jgi:cytochrome d ubiquinol oxidase subunit I